MAAIPLFSLFLLALAASFSAAEDSAAMTELRTGLIPNPSGWAAQSDYCHWPGVQCDASRSVTVIDLASRSLSGSLHAVRNLTELARLRLADNRFSGRLPDFSRCTALTELDLRGNAFTGPVVVTAMPPALKNLSLDGNYLQGALPEFGSRSVGVSLNNNSFCKTSPGNCDPQVLALLGVAEGFGFPLVLAQAWRGNNACQWELINCDHSGNVATITLINHDFRGGLISPELSQLRYLSCLTLKGNDLRGYVLERLGDLPQLK